MPKPLGPETLEPSALYPAEPEINVRRNAAARPEARMTISAVSTSNTSTKTTASSSSSSSVSDQYQMYLTLMLKQLECQDPTDPVDSSEFTSQLAQYSALEQDLANGETLTDISDKLSTMNFALGGVNYLGRDVECEGATAPLQDGEASWEYDLDSSAKSVTLSVTDENGKVVYQTTGDTDAGTNSFTWDGTGSNGTVYSSGAYTLTVTAKDSSGASIDSDIRFKGTVTAVDSSSGSTLVDVGGVSVALEDVVGVS